MGEHRLVVPLLLGLRAVPLVGQASPGGWHLVYQADSTGQATGGNKGQLLAAVRAGLPVRVGWSIAWGLPDGTSGRLEHVATAVFLTIHRDELFAQLTPILGQSPSAREPSIGLRTDGDRLWYGILSTTGRLLGYFTGGSPPTIIRVATSWYVQGVPPSS